MIGSYNLDVPFPIGFDHTGSEHVFSITPQVRFLRELLQNHDEEIHITNSFTNFSQLTFSNKLLVTRNGDKITSGVAYITFKRNFVKTDGLLPRTMLEKTSVCFKTLHFSQRYNFCLGTL